MTNLQPHINIKSGDISPYVLIPGDPARVRKIAEYFDDPKEVMFNREYLTINGIYKGVAITAMSTGMGCPSAAIAVEELAKVGAKVLIRIGTCGGLKKDILPGDLIIPKRALKQDGTTLEYEDKAVESLPNDQIFTNLVDSAQKLNYRYFTGVNRTHDAFYETIDNFLKLMELPEYENGELVSSEMECAAVFTVAKLRGLKAAAVLSVNTAEPLEEVKANPDIVYQLEVTEEAKKGVDRAIEVALNTIVKMDGKK